MAVEALTGYREQRSELSRRRGRFATETSSDVIRVAIEPFANRGRLAEGLAEILGIERFESDRQAIARKIQPEQGRPWSWEKLDDVVAEARQLLSGELNSWPAQDHRFEAALKAVPPERIDRLALYLPDDAVEVSFKDRAARSWQPLTQGSPGQQTAALLAFVLGYGSEPIILDQPEDDLDNTLIYELLVSRLRETKTKRQVIVVTHNPNIVVHGDAELVLSLKAAKGQSSIDCQGGLQERGVRDVICSVMEGGPRGIRESLQADHSLQGARHRDRARRAGAAHPPRRGRDAGTQARVAGWLAHHGARARRIRRRTGRHGQRLGWERPCWGPQTGSREIVGVPLDRLDAVEAWVREICNDSVKPPLDALIRKIEVPGADGSLVAVVCVEIDRSLFVHKSPGGYFRRIGSSKREMSPEVLARLFQERSQSRVIRFDESPVPGTSPEQLDGGLTRRFLRDERLPDETDLRKLRIVADDEDGATRITIAGVLLCTRDPGRWLPHAQIQAVSYAGERQDINYQSDARDIDGAAG